MGKPAMEWRVIEACEMALTIAMIKACTGKAAAHIPRRLRWTAAPYVKAHVTELKRLHAILARNGASAADVEPSSAVLADHEGLQTVYDRSLPALSDGTWCMTLCTPHCW